MIEHIILCMIGAAWISWILALTTLSIAAFPMTIYFLIRFFRDEK